MGLPRAAPWLLLVALAAHAEAPELDQAMALYAAGNAQDALPLLGRVAQNLDAAPGDRAKAYLYGGLCRAQRAEAELAHRNFLNAFLLDPSLALPEAVPPEVVTQAAQARDEAIRALDTRLGGAARGALQGITAGTPAAPVARGEPGGASQGAGSAGAGTAASGAASSGAATSAGAGVAPSAGSGLASGAEKPAAEAEAPPAPPTLLKSHLGAGVHGFYVIDEKTAGPAFDVYGGGRVGGLWLGAQMSLLMGDNLAGSLALRMSTYSEKTVAYMLGVQAGVLYSSAGSRFIPYAVVDGVGLSVRTPVLTIELRAISLGLYVTPAGLRFSPMAGVGVFF